MKKWTHDRSTPSRNSTKSGSFSPSNNLISSCFLFFDRSYNTSVGKCIEKASFVFFSSVTSSSVTCCRKLYFISRLHVFFFFRPEFLNRVDDSVVFHPLLQEHMSGIIKIQLERLKKRLHERNFSLCLTEKAVDFLAEVGYDPVYGARPLKRAIQKELETELARSILSGEFNEGEEVNANVANGKIIFEKITADSKD